MLSLSKEATTLVAQAARPRALCIAVAAAFGCLPLAALSNPTGGVAVHGQATFDASKPNTLVVTTQNGAGTNHSAINWQSFSIPAGSTTRINQPSATSMSINRVVTNTPTQIFGTLSSNGKVVLVNQAGIAVGTGAVVDTAGFTASAVGMSDADALAGRQRFDGNGLGNSTGVLSVQGNIIARGGDVVLIAPTIDLAKTAVVESEGGNVILAAGQSVEVTGRGLEGIHLQVQAPSDQAINLGTLKGDAVGIFAGTLKHSGHIQATSATLEGGKVVLKAKDKLLVDGTVRATGMDGKGGVVHASANSIVLNKNTLIDVSNTQGGGEILVGGGWHGQDARISNAKQTIVVAGAQLKADATQQGNGGDVVVWADGLTHFAGKMSSQGGAQGGNGGHAEVSGKTQLNFYGSTKLTAAKGRTGSLLLDPLNLTIDNTPDANGDGTLGDDVTSGGILSTAPGTNSHISANQVATLLSTGDLTLEATQLLTVANAVTKRGTGASKLTLKASQIRIDSAISTSAGDLDVDLINTGGSTRLNESINAGNGTITLLGNGAITQLASTSVLTAGALHLSNGSAGTTLSGNNRLANISVTGSGGDITLRNTMSNYSLKVGTISNFTLDSTSSNAIDVEGWLSARNVTINSGGGILATDLRATGNLTVNASQGNIEASGVVTSSGNAVFSAAAGSISLSGADSDFTRLQANALGTVVVNDVNSLTLLSVSGSAVDVTSAGNLLVQGEVKATSSGFIAPNFAMGRSASSTASAGRTADVTLSSINGSVALQSGALVSGAVIGVSSANGSVMNGAKISVGSGSANDPGSLTVNGNLTMRGGSSLDIHVTGANTSDTINIKGALSIATSTESIGVSDVSGGQFFGSLAFLTANTVSGDPFLVNSTTDWTITSLTPTSLQVNARAAATPSPPIPVPPSTTPPSTTPTLPTPSSSAPPPAIRPTSSPTPTGAPTSPPTPVNPRETATQQTLRAHLLTAFWEQAATPKPAHNKNVDRDLLLLEGDVCRL